MQLLFQTELSDELRATHEGWRVKDLGIASTVSAIRIECSAFQPSALNHTPEFDPRHATKARDQRDFVVGNNAL